MDYKVFGKQGGRTLLLLPGTACTWQLNFKNVVDDLAEKYRIIAVNYDGFEGDPSIVFTDMLTVTEKIEDYIIQNHGGRVDGAYGSSLGGSFVGLLIQRKRVHIDHGFIGSSDLDQGSPVIARLITMLVSPMLSGACKSEAKREKLKAKLQRKGAIGDGEKSLAFANDFIDSMKRLNPKTISREFYSDYVTPLENDIHVDGTAVHIVYALKMGEKYGRRYKRHFRDPDIHEFDMKHEVWLYDEQWKQPVLDMIDDCMNRACEERVTMGLMKRLFCQTRKPEGLLGKMMLSGMNPGHAKLADWGLTHLPKLAPERAIDIGCGGGRNAGELLKMYPRAHVTAVDYSELSVEKARAYNRDMIAAGRCDVRQGDASDLAFPDATFDLATAFETVYFWPGLVKCFGQVCRILKPGGVFMICNESDGTDATSKKFEDIIDGMKCYTAQELETALRAAGFAEVVSDHHSSRPWLTVVAKK